MNRSIDKSITSNLIVSLIAFSLAFSWAVPLSAVRAVAGWSRTVSGETSSDLVQTADGGFLIVSAGNVGGYLTPMLVKTDSMGNQQWNKTYDAVGIYSVIRTNDGGYAFLGDMWHIIVKIDADGNVEHSFYYDPPSWSWPSTLQPFSIVQEDDGSYVIAAGDYYDYLQLLKMSANGTWMWWQGYPSSNGFCMVETDDGGYVVTGRTHSSDQDCYLLKTDGSGNSQWYRTYGADDGYHETPYGGVVQSGDGGYIVAGRRVSAGAPFVSDCWLIKTDGDGNLLWERHYYGGNEGYYIFYSVARSSDGGFIMAGYYWDESSDLDWGLLARTDAEGNMQWSKKYAERDHNSLSCVVQTSDGGFVAAGKTQYEGYLANTWLIKTDEEGTIPEFPSIFTALLFMTLSSLAVAAYRTKHLGRGGHNHSKARALLLMT